MFGELTTVQVVLPRYTPAQVFGVFAAYLEKKGFTHTQTVLAKELQLHRLAEVPSAQRPTEKELDKLVGFCVSQLVCELEPQRAAGATDVLSLPQRGDTNPKAIAEADVVIDEGTPGEEAERSGKAQTPQDDANADVSADEAEAAGEEVVDVDGHDKDPEHVEDIVYDILQVCSAYGSQLQLYCKVPGCDTAAAKPNFCSIRCAGRRRG